MTQSDTDTQSAEETLPGDWSRQSVDDEDVHHRWRSDDLEMAVEVYEIDEHDIYSVEALQDVEAMGYTSSVTSHFESIGEIDEACETAKRFMEESASGEHAVEALCAFESEEMVDFVCVYVDDFDDRDDLEPFREVVQKQLGSAETTSDGISVIDDEFPESDAENVTFDVFPKTKPNVDIVGGDGE